LNLKLISHDYRSEKEILVGFACGHVFHLSHLEPQPATGTNESTAEDDATERLSPTGTTDEPSYATSWTVGPKVITARLIRDKIKEGCRICAPGREVEKAATA
jgi:vacuolar protein sorting-associated protein 41